MCFLPSPVKAEAAQPPPTNNVADNLQLGVSGVQSRNAGLLGRLALTAPKAHANTPGATPAAGNTSSTPGGTLGLPSDFGGNIQSEKPGVPNYGTPKA